jgi:hypothetical protein
LSLRSRYINLVIKQRLSASAAASAEDPTAKHAKDSKKPKDSGPQNAILMPELTEEEENELHSIERDLPLVTLVVFRQLAVVQARQKAKKLFVASHDAAPVRKAPSPQKSSSSWFSWGGLKSKPAVSVDASSHGDVEEEDEAAMLERAKEQLTTGFKIDLSADGQSGQMTWRLSLASSAVLNVMSGSCPVIQANMAVSLNADMNPKTGICAKFSLDELIVRDLLTPNPIFPNLINVPTMSKTANKLSIFFESKDKQSKVRLEALPFELVWNKPCIQEILDIVIVPKPHEAYMAAAQSDETIEFSELLVPRERYMGEQMTVVFEADAPKIIIPDNCSNDEGFLYLDAGKLSVRGRMRGPEGMEWHVLMTSINAYMSDTLEGSSLARRSMGTPDSWGLKAFQEEQEKRRRRQLSTPRARKTSSGDASIASAGLFSDGHTAYLIKPFNLQVDVQNLDKKDANLTVSVVIDPGLRGDLDELMLSRVLNMSTLVSSTFKREKKVMEKVQTVRRNSLQKLRASEVVAARAKLRKANSTWNTGMISDSNDEKPPNTPTKRLARGILDPDRYDVLVYVVIKEITLDLQYDMVNCEHIVLSAAELAMDIKTRIHDTQMFFTMNALSIQDTNRSSHQQDLAWSRPVDGKPNLINISYCSLDSARSSLYEGYGKEIKVEFGSLFMSLDTNTVMHLRPFYEVTLGKRYAHPNSALVKNNQFVFMIEEDSDDSDDESEVEDISLEIAKSRKPPGTRINCAFNQISVELLKAELITMPNDTSTQRVYKTPELNKNSSFGHESSARASFPREKGSPDEEDYQDTSLMHSAASWNEIPKSRRDLDSVVCLDITGLYVEVLNNQLIKTKARMHSFEIKDTREVSQDNEFKVLFKPDFEINKQREKSEESFFPSVNSKPDLQQMGGQLASSSNDFNKTAESNDLLVIDFYETANHMSFVDIKIGDLTSYFSLDIVLELVDLFVDNTMALLNVVASVKKGTFRTPDPMNRLGHIVADSTVRDDKSEPHGSISGKKTGRGGKNESDAPSSVLTVNVNAPNIRLILLEDPTILQTRAVVGRLGVDVKYSRDTTKPTKELMESLHVSVIRAELFVLPSMARWNPMQVLEPFGVEFHMNKTKERDITTSVRIALDMDAIDGRVSLNDIMLAKAISARGLVGDKGISRAKEAEQLGRTALVAGKPAGTDTSVRPITAYGITVNVGTVTLVTINDFNGQNLPILKVSLSGTTFGLDGAIQTLQGSGSFLARVDYFNPKVFVWEPVIDPWFPTISVTSDMSGVNFEIADSGSVFQTSITGTMLESLFQTIALLLEPEEPSDRIAAPAVTFQNLLGVPVAVMDGDNVLYELNDDGVVSLARTKAPELGHGSGALRSSTQDVHSFGLKFLGRLGFERFPLSNLPVHVSKPHIYQIASKETSPTLNPVIEEIYENQRYQPLGGSWKAPFLMSDPAEYTDADMNPRDRDRFPLPAGGDWDWEGKWSIETSKPRTNDRASPKSNGSSEASDIEIDAQGWEYAPNFQVFLGPHKRRGVPQSIDYVRRRRWLRTRVPAATVYSDANRPMNLFWDVQMLASGCRQVVIRSAFQVMNKLSFPIILTVQSSATHVGTDFGPIEPGATFSIPLLFANVRSASLKPANGLPYSSSNFVSTEPRVTDYEVIADVECESLTADARSIYCRVFIRQVEKSMSIVIVPMISIPNMLPCPVRYRIVQGIPQSGAAELPVEEGTVEAGDTCHIYHVSDIDTARISLQTGAYAWSNLMYIVGTRDKAAPIALCPTNSIRPGLYLNIKTDRGVYRDDQIFLFSTAILVDRTGLDMCVKSKYKDGSELIRKCSAMAAGSSISSLQPGFSPGVPRETVKLERFVCHSSRTYICTTALVGDPVYTDRDFLWTYLPDNFSGHTYIQTPSADRNCRLKEIISFEVARTSMVFVLYDIRTEMPPKWMSPSNGFVKLIEQAKARWIVNDASIDYHFAIVGKIVSAKERIVLGSNNSRDSRDMYCVFVVPDIYEKLRDQLTFGSQTRSKEAAKSWSDGSNGLTLFNYHFHQVQFGVRNGECFSKDLSMNRLSSAKGPFEIIEPKTNRAYQLCYSVKNMPGKFNRTLLTTVMPRYCIVNCMDEPIEVRQKGTRRATYVPSYRSEGWHKSEAELGTEVQIKTNSTIWSFGTVDLNEIGSTVLMLPLVDGYDEGDNGSRDAVIVHVDVKFAEAEENCAVAIIIWKEEVDASTAFSIKNDSSHPVVLQQAGVNFSASRNDLIAKFERCVQPRSCVPFGWVDPGASTKVLVAAGTTMVTAGRRTAEVDLTQAGYSIRIGTGSQSELVLRVNTSGSGRVLHILDSTDDVDDEFDVFPSKLLADTDAKMIHVSLKIEHFCVSLVLDRPYRREFLSFVASNFESKHFLTPATHSTEITVKEFQVDNYCETAVYNVLLFSSKPPKKKGEVTDENAIKFCSVKRNLKSHTQHYQYVALRILPLIFEIDSGTIQILSVDLLKYLKIVSRDEAMAAFSAQKWIDNFNEKLLSPENKLQLVDVYRSKVSAQEKKIYFESFILHPVRVTLSFQQTPFPRPKEVTAADIITAFAAVDRMDIKINSFIADNVIESSKTLTSRIQSKFFQDMQRQIAKIAGSLAVLGSPAGFVRNVGNGVHDFFYEPYLGLVQGPEELVMGIGRGATSLVSGVVTGALSSAAALVGTASSGLALLSGDDEYIKSSIKSRQKATRSGLMSGLVVGGESVVSGISSGVTGLFTKPIEEAQKDGALGFIRGVGMGVFGAAVKPVIGVTDGLTSIAHGISNELSDTAVKKALRPARTFARSEADPSELVLVPVDLLASRAQAMVLKIADKTGVSDKFVDCVVLDKATESMVILSEKYLYWCITKEKMWSRAWVAVSHVFFEAPQFVIIVLYDSSGQTNNVAIPCPSQKVAVELYQMFFVNAFRMGNPGSVPKLKSVLRSSSRDSQSSIPVPASSGVSSSPPRTSSMSNTSSSSSSSVTGSASSGGSAPDDSRPSEASAGSRADEVRAPSVATPAAASVVTTRVRSVSNLPPLGIAIPAPVRTGPSVGSYRFGSANIPQAAMRLPPGAGMDGRSILSRAQSRLNECDGSWAALDRICFALVTEWCAAQDSSMRAARCCVMLLVNQTRRPIQVEKMELLKGHSAHLLPQSGFIEDSKLIDPNGVVVFFATANKATAADSGHTAIGVTLTAARIIVSSEISRSVAEPIGDSQVGFLEKSTAGFWSKYTVFIW